MSLSRHRQEEDLIEGKKICTLEIPASDSWQDVGAKMEKVFGVHVLEADFSECGTDLLQLDKIRFGR